MTDITVYSADNQAHVFPEGTDSAVIDRVMKSYVQKGAPTKAPPPVQAPGPGFREQAEDALRSLPTGIEKGAVGTVFGIPTLAQMGQAAGEKLPDPYGSLFKKLPETLQKSASPLAPLLNPKYNYSNVQQKLEEAAATSGRPIHQPTTPAGEASETVGSFIPAMGLGAPGTLPMRAVQGLGAGLGAATAGALTKDTPLGAYKPGFEMLGALMGHKIAPRVVTPFPTLDKYHADQVKVLADKNIPLTAARATGSPFLAQRESNLGPRVTGGATEGQAYSRAVLKELGVDDARALPGNLKSAQDVFKKGYDDFMAHTTLMYPTGLKKEVEDIGKSYLKVATNPQDTVQKLIERIKNGISGKTPTVAGMTGPQYQNLRESIGNQIEGAASFAEKDALINIRKKLDDSFKQSLPTNAARADWDKLNQQYANWKVVSSAKIPGDKIITPEVLAAAVAKARSTQQFNLSEGTLASLAHAGEKVLSERPKTQKGLSDLSRSILALGGAGGGYHYGGQEMATSAIMGQMIAGEALPNVVASTLRSAPFGAAYNAISPWLSNQALVPKAGRQMSESERFARALAATGGQPSLPTPQGPSQ